MGVFYQRTLLFESHYMENGHDASTDGTTEFIDERSKSL